MTDAIITDINEFRKRKNATGFEIASWSDERVATRYKLLKLVKDQGVETFGGNDSKFFRLAFPNGYDPANHPEDDIDVVYAEGARRGVFPTLA